MNIPYLLQTIKKSPFLCFLALPHDIWKNAEKL